MRGQSGDFAGAPRRLFRGQFRVRASDPIDGRSPMPLGIWTALAAHGDWPEPAATLPPHWAEPSVVEHAHNLGIALERLGDAEARSANSAPPSPFAVSFRGALQLGAALAARGGVEEAERHLRTQFGSRRITTKPI